MPKILYTLYVTFFKNFFRRCWKLPQQALNDRCQTKITDLSKCLPAQVFVAHTQRFVAAKEKLNSSARKRFELRHNINEATCAKLNEWL